MKTSNLILTILLTAVIGATAFVAFFNGPFMLNLPKKPLPVSAGETESQWSKDSLSAHYRYLWTDFPEVELNPFTENFVEFHSIGSGKHLFTLEVRHDTLFVRQNPPNDYEHFNHLTTDQREYETRIIVGAKALKGITAVNRGRIFHLGHERTAIDLVWPGMQDQLFRVSEIPLEYDHLDINLHKGGDAVLKVNASSINVNMSGHTYFHTYSRLRLWGQSRRLSIHHEGNRVDVKTHWMQADTVLVDTYTPPSIRSNSLIRVKVSDYLNARIDGWSDVLYMGQPNIKKKEWSYGRLIDGNYYP